jgi:hypothetical protein
MHVRTPILVACTVGTQTQEKKNRKKRAFLGINDEANMKKIKKLKVTDKSKEVYDTYIRRRCVRPPVEGEPERYHLLNLLFIFLIHQIVFANSFATII